MHRKGEDEAARVVREMESDGIASDDGQVNCKNRYGVVTRDIHPVYIGRARITPWGGSAHHARKKPPRTCVRMCVYIRRTPTYVEESEACEAPSLPPSHPSAFRCMLAPEPLPSPSPSSKVHCVARHTAVNTPPSIDENARATFTYVLRKEV